MSNEFPITIFDGQDLIPAGQITLSDEMIDLVERDQATFALSPTLQVVNHGWDNDGQQERREFQLLGFDILLYAAHPTADGEPEPF